MLAVARTAENIIPFEKRWITQFVVAIGLAQDSDSLMVARLSSGGGTSGTPRSEAFRNSHRPISPSPSGALSGSEGGGLFAYSSPHSLPREVEGLDISTYSNLKHAFEIIVHSYKLQKEALEANRRRWGEERQDLLSREHNLVEALSEY